MELDHTWPPFTKPWFFEYSMPVLLQFKMISISRIFKPCECDANFLSQDFINLQKRSWNLLRKLQGTTKIPFCGLLSLGCLLLRPRLSHVRWHLSARKKVSSGAKNIGTLEKGVKLLKTMLLQPKTSFSRGTTAFPLELYQWCQGMQRHLNRVII